MAHWYYKGRTTASINHPSDGPIVLTPRMRFEAPVTSVQHLVNADLVKRLPEPVAPKKATEKKQEVAPDGASTKSEKKEEAHKSAIEPDVVVASPAAEEEVVSTQEGTDVMLSNESNEVTQAPRNRRTRTRSGS